jgi:hypothetical protein
MLESPFRRGTFSTIATWPTWRLVLTGAFASFAAQYAISVCMGAIFGYPSPAPNMFAGRPRWVELLFAVALAPWYETLIFQWAIMKRLHGPLRRSWRFAGCVSTLIFGLGDGYTDWRALSLLSTATVFAAVFAIEARRAGSPYLAAVSTHGLFNGLATWYHWS